MLKISNKDAGPICLSLKSPDGQRTLAKFIRPGQSVTVDENTVHMPQVEKMVQSGVISTAVVKS